jgi:DNA invertase Pin-like site-specific DNA recombinase
LEAPVIGQRVGYVRVSTLDQIEKRQLEGQDLERVFTDKASGRDTVRPQLTEMLLFARDGDIVVVHSMDQLARNLDDLRALVQGLTCKGVRVEFVKESLVFTGEDSPMANLMLSVMGAFAEFERSLIRNGRGKASPWRSSAAPTRQKEDPHTGTSGRTGPARRQRCT